MSSRTPIPGSGRRIRAPAPRRGRGDRLVWRFSLGASALIHALLSMITLEAPSPTGIRDTPGQPGPSPDGHAVRVLEIVEVPAEDAAAGARAGPSDVETPRRRPGDAPTPAVPSPRADDPGETAAPSRSPAWSAERLRPGRVDPRLWKDVPDALGPVRADAAAAGERARLEARVDSLNAESSGITIPPGEDMGVWTGRDAEGHRWGLSPGRLHLGSVTVALCSGTFDASNCGFGVPPGRRDEYRLRLRAVVELGRQGDRGSMLERARAIRARLDSLRDSIAPAGT